MDSPESNSKSLKESLTVIITWIFWGWALLYSGGLIVDKILHIKNMLWALLFMFLLYPLCLFLIYLGIRLLLKKFGIKINEGDLIKKARKIAVICAVIFILHCILYTIDHEFNLSFSNGYDERGDDY